MKFHITTLLLLIYIKGFAQADTVPYIKVNFLYGSRPERAHKDIERKSFGGIHGGHVTIQVGDVDYGFRRTSDNTHLFPRKNPASTFSMKRLNGKSRYEAGRKTVTFIIPVTPQQYDALQRIHDDYCAVTPFDYAFFGMRCTSTTQEILGEIGILKNRSRFSHVVTAFYPKKLRKRMFRLARKNNYQIIRTEGRPTRKWERD
jgi:hypothetical protein